MTPQEEAFVTGFVQTTLALGAVAVMYNVAESVAGARALSAPVEAPPEDPEHQVIRRLAKARLRLGAAVAADIPGWPRPATTHGRIADVHAIYPNGDEELIEVEREETAYSWHARQQDDAFRRWESRPTLVRRTYRQVIVGTR